MPGQRFICGDMGNIFVQRLFAGIGALLERRAEKNFARPARASEVRTPFENFLNTPLKTFRCAAYASGLCAAVTRGLLVKLLGLLTLPYYQPTSAFLTPKLWLDGRARVSPSRVTGKRFRKGLD